MFLYSEFPLISCSNMKFVLSTTVVTSLHFDFNPFAKKNASRNQWTSDEHFPRNHSKSLGRFAIVLNNHSCHVLVWWSTIVKDSFLWWLLSQQKAICKHIRLVHVSEFSYMKRNPRRRHDVDSCHFTKFIHTNSLWHRDGYDISCHQTCSNPSLCWALLHRSPVCLNTRICATAMNSSICHCETSGMLMSLHKTCYWRHLPLMPSPKLH